MAIYLNNQNSINDIRTALNLINGLARNIIEYDNLVNILNNELYYVLKYKSYNRNPQNPQNPQIQQIQQNPTRNDILCALINKLDGFYIKTPEVKKIINYISYSTDADFIEHTWFIKNVEKGYVPTAVVLKDILRYLNFNNIEYLHNKFDKKINASDIFTFKILYNDIFNSETKDYNPVKSYDIFRKFNLSNNDISKIMDENSCNLSFMKDIQQNFINNYFCNIIKFKKQYNFKMTGEELNGFLEWIERKNQIIPIMNDVNNMNEEMIQIINDFKSITNHLSKKNLLDIISTILRNTGMTNGVSNVVILLNFIKNNCSYDKFNKIDLSDLLSNYYIARFPFVNLDDFYDGEKDIELLDLLIFYQIIDEKLYDLIINKKFIDCSNEEIFKIAFQRGNIKIIKDFINKKFTITEDMILTNKCNNLLDILVLCSENGFYITEKCFPHLVYTLYINSQNFDYNIEKIKKVSIYVNDNEEFEKHKKKMQELNALYNKLEKTILNNYNATMQYFKTNQVTEEHIVIASNMRVKDFLISKLLQQKEYNKSSDDKPNKTVVTRVVKKVIKKVVKKNTEQNE
jgi:hypothetical protein